jgi:hypothetical protein
MLFRIIRFASHCKFVNSKLLYIKYLYYHLLGLLQSLLVPDNTQYDQLNKAFQETKRQIVVWGEIRFSLVLHFTSYVCYHASVV